MSLLHESALSVSIYYNINNTLPYNVIFLSFRLPEKYSSLSLPNKLPPKREPIPISGLPMLGYMEQTLEVAIRKAATAVGCLKPKFPFLSVKQSALLYVAYHLKGRSVYPLSKLMIN